jgi:hypothetical protein
VVLANVMHDAYCTFKVPALQQQVQRKESIALIYQNAELMLTCQAVRVGAFGLVLQTAVVVMSVQFRAQQILQTKSIAILQLTKGFGRLLFR